MQIFDFSAYCVAKRVDRNGSWWWTATDGCWSWDWRGWRPRKHSSWRSAERSCSARWPRRAMARSILVKLAANYHERYRTSAETGLRKIKLSLKNWNNIFALQPPQRAYSDAYITGMSSKRRKILQAERPSTNVQQLVAEGVRQVAAATKKPPTSSSSSSRNAQPDDLVSAISSDPAVLSAYRDEVKAIANQRLKNDPDYDGEKYPHSSKAFK